MVRAMMGWGEMRQILSKFLESVWTKNYIDWIKAPSRYEIFSANVIAGNVTVSSYLDESTLFALAVILSMPP